MYVYLVRHAEALSNVQRGGQKAASVDSLTTKGQKQVDDLAAFFSKNTVSMVFTSPILRAKDTAARVFKYTVPIQELDEARERRGVPEISYASKDLERSERLVKVRSEGGSYPEWEPEHDESFDSLIRRVVHVVEILKSTEVEKVALVSHKGFLSAFIYFLEQKGEVEEESLYNFMSAAYIPNASVSTVKYDVTANEWSIVELNRIDV